LKWYNSRQPAEKISSLLSNFFLKLFYFTYRKAGDFSYNIYRDTGLKGVLAAAITSIEIPA
jgi:hypothetical protein